MMDVATRFGENLRRVRKGAGISQEELGLRSSLHRTEIGLELLPCSVRTVSSGTLAMLKSSLAI